jgi:hypothetical protein
VHKHFGWILIALVPAVTLAAMTVSPRNLENALVAQRALALEQPEDARVFNDLGNLLVLAGELDQAEAAYSRALELDPTKVSTRFNLGLLQQQLGRFRDALEQYRAVLDIDPYHAWSYYQMGTLFDHWREDDLAVKYYAEAFSLDPELAFPEVNPHVIDNRLLTEALLKAHSGQREIPSAPKAYDEPGRIAQLLVPPIPAESGNGEAGEETEEGEDELTEGVPEGESAVQQLSDRDLDPDAAANQAAPPAGFGRGSVYRPPSRIQRRPGNLRRFNQRRVPTAPVRPRTGGGRPLTAPRNSQQGVPLEGATGRQAPTRNPAAGRPGAGTAPGGRSLTPNAGAPTRGDRSGTSSTGRLEIRLDPVGPGPATDEMAAG